ncbi:MAG: hypothetical protein K2M42_12135 [Oscillospiraceae bacterium]|nr:hypothetical protein [Oscillospiraceae bacterium]
MTREEAVKALSLMEHVESIVAAYEPGEIRNDTTVRELKEACRAAAAALRAQQAPAKLDRSQWEGCEWCISLDKSVGAHECGEMLAIRGVQYTRCGDGTTYSVKEQFCPICGRPLNEEAWAELERRIGGNDEKSNRN